MRPTVLLIEDNDLNMDVMLFALKGSGLAVIPVLNGPAGLSVARAELPDLIICDIQMPHLDGLGVLRGLKTDPATAQIPVIALTAMKLEGDAARLLSAGFDHYLSKPVHFTELKHALQRYLPAWRGRVALDT